VEHIAIDLGGRESQICVMSAEGDVVLEERRPKVARWNGAAGGGAGARRNREDQQRNRDQRRGCGGAGNRRSSLPTTDDSARSRACDSGEVRSGDRRREPVSQRCTIALVFGLSPGRELQLRSSPPDINYEGGRGAGPVGADPSGMVRTQMAQERPDGPMGARGGTSARSSRGSRGFGAQDRRNHVCDLARSDRVRPDSWGGTNSRLTAEFSAGCADGGHDGNRLSKGGDRVQERESLGFGRDEFAGPMATRRRISTLVPESTNSRLGQPASSPRQRFIGQAGTTTAAEPDTCVLTGRSLHSRS
jgi:hypothetical protein